MRRPALLPLALLLAGCPRLPPVARPYPAPTAAELLARINKQVESVKTMRAEAKVDYLAEHAERIKVRMTMLVEAPDKLRFEAESPMGGSVASLATDGKRFELLDVRANRFLAGEATPCNIARLIRVELPPAAVVAMVDGSAPILDVAGAASGAIDLAWDPADGGREVLTLKAPSGASETIRLDARGRTWDVLEAEVRGPDGKVELRLVHEGFADQGGVRLPEVSTVEQPLRHADARIRYRSRELGVQPPPNAFELRPPEGLPVENVSCE